jgi:cytochrome oxidase Cu insertion factor (SCO1/SenC/PrrC family)
MSRRAPWRSHSAAPLVAALLAALGLAPWASGQTLLPPDPARTVGRLVSFAGFVDEDGHVPATLPGGAGGNADPRPWIVSPMYTRCPTTCSAVTANLHRALAVSGLAPAEYRVLSFSFDPDETPDGLRSFRVRMHLPPGWLTLRAGDRAALERTLRSLDFRTMTMGDGTFTHPNLVAVLTPDGRLARYLFGIDVPARSLARAVRSARAGVSTLDDWRPRLFLTAVLGFLASAGLLAFLVSRRRARTASV